MALTPGAEHHVSRHAHRANKAHAQAVLGDEGHCHAALPNVHRVHSHQIFGFTVLGVKVCNGAGGNGVKSGNGLQKLPLAAAGDTGNTENLTGVDREADIIKPLDTQLIVDRQIVNDQSRGHIHRIGPVDIQADAVADHHVRQGLLVGVLCGDIADVFTLAEYGHPVGYVQYLVELVGDDDEGFSVRLHVPHDLEQLIRFLRCQDCGGFIQNQNVGAAIKHLENFNGLLLGNRHIVYLLVGVDIEAVFFAKLLYLFPGLRQIQPSVQTQNDIFRGGEHIYQLEVLVNHADAIAESILGRGDGGRLSVNVDLSLIREVDAGEHIHQRCFSAAVFA